jgi:hypothetical protein
LNAPPIECPGTSPTITTPSVLKASSMRAIAWRELVSASASVE